MLLEGLHIPLTTPFHSDGRLNPRKLEANVERYSRTPAAGLIVLGPAGEPTLLSDDETRDALRTAAESAAPEKVLIAGISRDSVHATIDLSDFAAEQNYDCLLVRTPSIPAASTRELLTYFQTIADRSPLPIVLLSGIGRSIPTDAIVALALHPNILGLLSDECDSASVAGILTGTAAIRREVTVTPVFAAVTRRMKNEAASSAATSLISTRSLAGAATAIAEPPPSTILRTRTKTVGFQIIAGDAARMLVGVRAGAVGMAAAFAACAPQACYEVFAAWKDDDQPLAEEKQARLIEASRLAESLGPGGLKFGCDLNGYFGGIPRLPHLPPTGEERDALQQLMKPLRN